MGKNIDKTFIQSKMLNSSKGPAVHSLRAQADKSEYSRQMRRTLENTEHLTIRQAEVADILTDDDRNITGVKTYSGAVYHCRAVVLCTGTYLKARCIYGDVSSYTGPNGLQAANHLTDAKNGLNRDKTALRRVLRRVWTDVPSIFPRWRSSLAISILYHFHLQPILMIYRRSRLPAILHTLTRRLIG